jgi:hypothetical protein
MMDAGTQLLYVVIGALSVATLLLVVLLICRREVALGLTKFFLRRFGRRPIRVVLQGPDGAEKTYIVGTKGKEVIKIDGGVYMLRERAIRKSDDNINVIYYSFKNTLPYNPLEPRAPYESVLTPKEEELLRKLREKIPLTDEERHFFGEWAKGRRERADNVAHVKTGTDRENAPTSSWSEPVNVEEAAAGTSPTLLDKFVEYVYLAAKAEALKKLGNIDFWIKAGAVAAAGAALLAFLAWKTGNGDILPIVKGIAANLENCRIFFANTTTTVAGAAMNATITI